MERNHPQVLEFGYHYRAMYQSTEFNELEAVATSIKKTVAKGHKELPFLRQAYQDRHEEIRLVKEKEAAEKAKAALEKAKVNNDN